MEKLLYVTDSVGFLSKHKIVFPKYTWEIMTFKLSSNSKSYTNILPLKQILYNKDKSTLWPK